MKTCKKVSDRHSDSADGRLGLLSQYVTYVVRHARSNRRVGLDDDNLLQFDRRTATAGDSQTCADCGQILSRTLVHSMRAVCGLCKSKYF